ncbi:hypothetical protein D9X91_17830 [Falsibacillus albus]|uniref:Uncharacterized protein n=1 Tax=Falsibacillus albus TaxID=2478915 RepID=A0A3L7JR91_9BACI|nr:hypothetical protein D9X91_17830 [Falsibacillus albus]
MLAQDKEIFDSDTSHEEKCLAFFEDVPNLIEHPPNISLLRCGVSPVQLQDLGARGVAPRQSPAAFPPGPLIPPESRTFSSNQQHMASYFK